MGRGEGGVVTARWLAAADESLVGKKKSFRLILDYIEHMPT